MNADSNRSVGFCIYCGANPISAEHWLPVWLGGHEKLLKASCNHCQDLINRVIENPMARGPFWSARKYLGFPSRRKHKEPLPITLVTGEVETKVLVSDLDNPAMLILMSLPPPSIFSQQDPLPPRNGIWHGTISGHVFDEKRRLAFALAHPSDSFHFGILYAETFLRFLAKVALGAAVMNVGYENFRPLVREVVLQENRATADFYVGGTSSPIDLIPITEYHKMGVGWTSIRNQNYLIVNLHFFADLEMPVYSVVVGEEAQWSDDTDLAKTWGMSVELARGET